VNLDRVFKELKKEELVRLNQDLIRIPSVRREGEKEEKVALFLAHLFEEMGLDVVVEEVEPGSPNVIAVLHGQEERPCLILNATRTL
jgi:acetylornithine deacetylase/succinyl-diaminopimelate desuccinylase-like protein